MFVRLCVCLSVCSLLRYHLNIFLPLLPEVGCPTFFEIQNQDQDQEVMFSNTIIESLQKLFAYKGCKITVQKKVFFSANFALLAGFFFVLLLLFASINRCFVSHLRHFCYEICGWVRYFCVYLKHSILRKKENNLKYPPKNIHKTIKL